MATLLIIDLSVKPYCHYCITASMVLCLPESSLIISPNEVFGDIMVLAAPFYHKQKLSEQGVKYSGPHIWNKLPLSC